jgi:hypothetical protein
MNLMLILVIRVLIIGLVLAGGAAALAAEEEDVVYVDQLNSNRSYLPQCGSETNPCATLALGLQRLHQLAVSQEFLSLLIAGGSVYQLNQTGYTDFSLLSNIEISGFDSNYSSLTNSSTAVIKCSDSAGFSFIYANNITLSNMIFDDCGQLRNSTSYDNDPRNLNYVQFIVTLYFLYCRDITISNVGVTNTRGTGAVIYNSIGTIYIGDSNFENNQFQDGTGLSGGGGLYIEFSYCDPLDTSCLVNNISNVNTSYTSNARYVIDNTVFCSNRANATVSNNTLGAYILPLGKFHSSFGRGGGLSLYVIGNATDVSIKLCECHFINNTALWGGGLLVEFHDSAKNNYVEVANSYFVNNQLYFNPNWNHGTGGGGARVTMLMFLDRGSIIYDNNVTFINCEFDSNEAYYGGGFSFYTSVNCPENSTTPNHVGIYSSNFTNNKARLGAAIDVSLYHPSINGIYPKVVMHDLIITNNEALYNRHHGTFVGIGAVYIDTVAVDFGGQNYFHDNRGSAMVLSKCQVDIRANTQMVFINNVGRNGGAMVMYAGGFIVTYSNSSLIFINNTADFYGGAIYQLASGGGDQFGSGNCFLRFYNIFVSPDKWTSRFYFQGNQVNSRPSAIHASTLAPCVWINGLTTNPVDQTFCWNDNWIYRDRYNQADSCHSQISTSPSKYTIPSSYALIPGQTTSLAANATDDMNNDVTNTTVFILRIVEGVGSFPGSTNQHYSYISHEQLQLLGKQNSTMKLQVETIDPIVIENEVEVNLLPCPPGFILSSDNTAEMSACICDKDYGGYIHCNQSNYSSSIIRLGWIGLVEGFNETLLFGFCPYLMHEKNIDQYTVLPQDPFKVGDLLCNSTHSDKALCGRCKEGYGVPADYELAPCTPCEPGIEKYSWILYLLTEFLPVTILFGLIFIFSMTVTFGPLNSYIFFAQFVTTVVTIDSKGQVPLIAITPYSDTLKSLYIIPYAVWNMNFFRTVLPLYCLNPHIDSLTVMNLGFLQAFYPLMLLLVFVVVMNFYNRGMRCVVCLCRPLHRCLARFRQWTNLRQSITGGMASFVVIAYTKFLLLAVYILTPTQLLYANGTTATLVFYFQGNTKYNMDNFKYMFPSIIVIILSFIPPFLLAYPTLLGIISFITCRKAPVSKLYPSLKLQAFLDEFHGCYKSGIEGQWDCRWFASLYFCLRFILILIFAVTSPLIQYTVQTALFLLVAALFMIFQPYRKSWINKLDMIMFLLLATLSLLTMYNLTMTLVNKSPSAVVFAIQYFLIFLPLLYCICHYVGIFCSRNKASFYRLRRSRTIETEANSTAPSGDIYQSTALLNSTQIPDFLDFIENTERNQENVKLNSGSNNYTGSSGASNVINEATPLLVTNEDTDRSSYQSAN